LRLEAEPPPAKAVQTTVINLHYVPAGETSLLGDDCQAFPADARTALEAAAHLWTGWIFSAIPIEIEACWATNQSDALAYASGLSLHKNFPGAPLQGVWYPQALSNALAGQDLDPAVPDLAISIVSSQQNLFYYGATGNPPAGKVDFITTEH
jgi:hypothetical protein